MMEDITRFLYEIGQLKRVKRSGWWAAGINNPESVAEHSFRVAILGFILAQFEGADTSETVIMCLFHDSHESRLHDLDKIGRKYISRENAKRQAFSDQVSRLPEMISSKISFVMSKDSNESIETKVTHDADLLECLIQAREYQAQGYKDVEDWIENCRANLITESAKKIAKQCLIIEPREWWRGII